MPVKFWHTIVRFWFFLSYLITTVERISNPLFIDYEHYKYTPTIFLPEKSLIEFFVYVKHTTYMNSHLFDNMFLFTILVKEKSQAHQNN